MLAIADAVEERLAKEADLKPSHVEGRRRGEWILLDYIDLVVHVFLEERRRFYGLERLWGDAPHVDIDEPVDSGPKPTRRAARRTPSASR